MDLNYNNQLSNSSIKKSRNHNPSFRPSNNRSIILQKQKNEETNFLKISTEAFHFKSKGEIVLDLRNDELTWSLKGEKSQLYIEKYKDKERISFKKSDIKKLTSIIGNDRILLKIELKNLNDSYIFSFQDKNYKFYGNKFTELLQNDYFNFYKTEYEMLSIENQKRICLLLNNKYLFLLFRKLIACSCDIEKAWSIIKCKYPEQININLGKNKIQLSRDEELIMFAQRKYNITKLKYSDDNIYTNYQSNLKSHNFWEEFIEKQRGNNTYLVGGYKNSVRYNDNDNQDNDKNEEEKPFNNLFEDLERDKYYYDCYETNYLYHNENMKKEQENLKDKIKLLNDYSINKMKNISYFSYSPLCINAFNKKGNNKYRNNKRYLNSSLNEIKMQEDKIEINIDNQKSRNKLSKQELISKIQNMKNEYKGEQKDNSCYSTMKAINEENYEIYNLSKFEPSRIPMDNYIISLINNTFMIKDLILSYKFENLILEKNKKQEEKSLLSSSSKSSSSSPQKNIIYFEQLIKNKKERYAREIKAIYENFKRKIKQKNDWGSLELIINFLLKNTEKSIEKANIG